MNDIVTVIIDDGNGDQCGVSYDQRCAAARNDRHDVFIRAVRRYSWLRHRQGLPELTHAEVCVAANELQEYYVDHIQEIDRHDND